MFINEDDVKNDSDNDLGDDFDYQPIAEDDAEDDDVDSLDSTSKSEEVCGVKRIADLMVEDIWNLEFRTEDEACQFYNAYSCWHGFVMRKDDVVRDNQGSIISRQLICNKEGGGMALKEYRNNELIADFKSQFSEPVMITSLEVYEKSASCYFTQNIFKEIRNKIQRAGALNIKSRKQGKSTPNVNVEGINDPFVVKSKGAPSKRSSWRKKRACSNCHKYGHYYKRCPDLMQHSVGGKPRDRSDGNASAKDSGFSPERFANCSRSISVKSEHHSGPKTKPFKKGGTRKFTVTGMRNRKGKDNSFDEVKESQQDKRHSFTNYECVNDVMDDKCDTRHVHFDVRDPLPSSLPCGNKQGSYMALFVSMHRTL
ncbi:hypothetical protein Ahy_A03g013215 isoform C [Arachis hypogaea]|uniref:CCHC-type domain-containing protein n=1 Tax=Arachis hypogaea TaxID=3818 RepID=A0A445DUX1_ARAHY|nr:hypothetical protein Ahy_A03g013215 isoform C [Arachis hypogaea]